jgi:hypothetical protein
VTGECPTPVDEATGVPYVLMPVDDLPPLPRDGRNLQREADWHHPFHPRAALVNQGPGLNALRVVRKQWALYGRHHNEVPAGYHSIFAGPFLPETEEDQFRTIVFAAAGFIPPVAIDFQRAEPHRLKPLTDEQRLQLWTSGEIRIDNEITVRDYLIRHALGRDFVDIKTSSVVDEFLSSPNRERRRQLGDQLLRVAAYQAADPLSPHYRRAKKDALIHPARSHSAGQFVLSSMGLARGRPRARQLLAEHLHAA